MSAPSSCPTADRLRQLLAGTPPGDEPAELLDHLNDCAACQRTLDALAGADPALLRAARALQRTEHGEELPLRRVLNELGSDANLTRLYRPDQQTASLQALLRPAGSAEALGQLDHYEVTELLGQGGMGVVVKAFDRPLKRWVAIKVLARDLAGDQVARQRFAREGQAAAAVRHEHVVTVHAVSESNGVPFLVMEYVAGGSLQDYLDAHGPPDWRVVARLGAEVAAGLAAAHAQGLVHRDIKPSNILLERQFTAENAESAEKKTARKEEEEELSSSSSSALSAFSAVKSFRAKIGDFGLARVADEARLTQTGIVPGTPMYMSPEQSLCEPLDGRADLFSLGSVLYALCTGREPFPAGSPVAVLRQVCEATPTPVRELNPAVPAWLAATVERLHAKRPADRFASAAEVADLLRYNLAHPDRPRQVAPPRPAARPRRTARRLLAAALGAGLLLAAGLALSEGLGWTHLAAWGPVAGTWAARVPLRATLRGHEGTVWSCAFAPDGRTLVTGGDDTTLRFWDVATGQEQGVRCEHGSAVLAVAFAHSGQFLVGGDSDGGLRVWDVATRTEGAALPRRGGNVRRLALAPDDRTVAVAGGGQAVELWDLDSRTLRQTLAGHRGTIMALAFAPDGRTLAVGDANGHVRFWDPASGDERANFPADPLGVRGLAFTPDGQTLASAGNGDKEVKLWNVASHEQAATLSGYENGVQNVAVAADGRLLATGSRDGTVKVWDLASARALATLPAHQGSVWAVAFSPDGRTLATVGEDHLGKLWDLSGLANRVE